MRVVDLLVLKITIKFLLQILHHQVQKSVLSLTHPPVQLMTITLVFVMTR